MKHLQRIILAVAALAAFTALAVSAPVRAAGPVTLTVGNCTNDSDLRNKLTTLQSGEGGTLTFNCGTATIKLSSTLPEIIRATVIDGSRRITLSGNNLVRHFRVGLNGQLTLKAIILDQGYGGDTFGGAILNQGVLTLDHTTIQYSHSAYDGGAIASFNQLELIDSLLTNNYAYNGGAIYADDFAGGTRVKITRTQFRTNHSTRLGGAILANAPLEIVNGDFLDNKAANGGAVYARSMSGSSSIRDTALQHNGTTGVSPDGNGGALVVDSTTVTVQHSSFQHNSSKMGGAAYILPTGKLILTDSVFSDNDSYFEGGAVYNGGSTAMTNATLARNRSAYGSGIQNRGDLSLTNATLSGNLGTYSGAVGNEKGAAYLTNVTFSGNSALDTVPAGILNLGRNTLLYLKNTIVANSLTGINCKFIEPPAASEYNLSSDYSCNFGVGRNNLDLRLAPLASNGGLTQTHLPLAGSPAIGAGNNSYCPATDQRGVLRPQGTTCDVGAVEVKPATPTPTRTKTATATRTPTKTATRTATKTPTRTATRTATKTATPIRTATKTATRTATRTATKTATRTATRLPTRTATIKSPVCAGKPANSGKVKTLSVVLDWRNVPCLETYKVIVRLGSRTGPKIQKRGGLTKSEFTPQALVKGQTYAWRVTAIIGTQQTKSDWWTFKVK